jgi:hypothetical protein
MLALLEEAMYSLTEFARPFTLSEKAINLPEKVLAKIKPEQFMAIEEGQVVKSDALMLKDMGDCGFGLVAVSPIKAEQVILYTGNTIPHVTEESQFPYGLSIKIANKRIAVDAEKEGAFARYIQHLPTEDVLKEYYTIPGGLSKSVAVANCRQSLVKLGDDFYLALIFDKDVEASLESPALLGFNYGMEGYWESNRYMPKLFDRSGQAIDTRFYSYHPKNIYIKAKPMSFPYPNIPGGYYEMLLTFNKVGLEGHPVEFSCYKAQIEAKVGVKTTPLIVSFQEVLKCQILGFGPTYKDSVETIKDFYIPMHKSEVDLRLYESKIRNFVKFMPENLSRLVDLLVSGPISGQTFFMDKLSGYKKEDITHSLVELTIKCLVSLLRFQSDKLKERDPKGSMRLQIMASIVMNDYMQMVVASNEKHCASSSATRASAAYDVSMVMAGAGAPKEPAPSMEP